MHQGSRAEAWNLVKYGRELIPWECQIEIENIEGNNCGEWKSGKNKMKYCFSKNDKKEREPMRYLEI